MTLFNKLGEVEHHRKQLKKAETSDFGGSYSSKLGGKASTTVEKYRAPFTDFLWFEPVSKAQFVSGPVTSHFYSRGTTLDYSELSYKLIKSEARLVRSTLETYGFNYTDSHDWNLLWLCVPGKPYLYEGLNEH